MIFSDYSRTWVEQILELKKPATIASVKSHLRRLDACFGAKEITSISESDVQKFIGNTHKSLSAGSVKNCANVLRLVLNRAKRDGFAVNIPAPELPKSVVKPQPFFDLEELRVLSKQNVLWWLFSETGLRAGEALALKNSDIDFERETLTVNRSVYAAKTQEPKTSNAFRTISISHRLCHAIKNENPGVQDEFLFPTRTGNPQYQTNVLRKLHADLEELKIPVMGFHAFRRGNATLSSEIGMPIKTISARHGRRTGDLTIDVYICSKLDDKKYAENLGEILSR